MKDWAASEVEGLGVGGVAGGGLLALFRCSLSKGRR